MFSMSDNTKIGTLLVALGFLFIFLGVLLFFDSGLLAIGNVLLLCGFPFLIGFSRTLFFFNPIKRKDKWQGIVLFFLGILLVLFKWAFIGIVLEMIGLVAMFAPFLPIVLTFLQNVPTIGWIFASPVLSKAVERVAGAAGKRAPV